MMSHVPTFRWNRAGAVMTALLVALSACGEGPQSPLVPEEVSLAKGGGGGKDPTVSLVNPSYGHQGDVSYLVTINGSGFAAGAMAAFERNGVPDPKVTVSSTQFVSSSQVIATVTISGDADIALYDVSVTNLDRKKGIGTAMFEVTTAEVIGSLGGSSYVNDINEVGGIVGYCTGNAACTGAFIYEDGVGLKALGTGSGWGADPLGTMVLGRSGGGFATAWVRQSNGTYVEELLPSSGVGGFAFAGARDASGTLIVGGADQVKLSRNDKANRPVVWTRTGSSWSAPVFYAYPAAATRASIRDLNGSGQAIGASSDVGGIVWENASTYLELDGSPWEINDAGTLVAGQRNGQPVYWARNPTTLAWNPASIPLPSVSGTCDGAANDVNDDGIIVGYACNGNSRQAVYWRLDMSGPTPVLIGGANALPGLGATGGEKSAAVAVSASAPYVVAGGAAPNGQNLVVRWIIP